MIFNSFFIDAAGQVVTGFIESRDTPTKENLRPDCKRHGSIHNLKLQD